MIIAGDKQSLVEAPMFRCTWFEKLKRCLRRCNRSCQISPQFQTPNCDFPRLCGCLLQDREKLSCICRGCSIHCVSSPASRSCCWNTYIPPLYRNLLKYLIALEQRWCPMCCCTAVVLNPRDLLPWSSAQRPNPQLVIRDAVPNSHQLLFRIVQSCCCVKWQYRPSRQHIQPLIT